MRTRLAGHATPWVALATAIALWPVHAAELTSHGSTAAGESVRRHTSRQRPLLVWRGGAGGAADGAAKSSSVQLSEFASPSTGRESIGAKAAPRGWVGKIKGWAEENTAAPWFPWVLAIIGFLDSFTLCGFLLTPLLSLALMASDAVRATVLCSAASCGCLAGNGLLAFALRRLGMSITLPDGQLVRARDLLQRHGSLAGLLNTLLPLPTIPLIVASVSVGVNVHMMLLAMTLGRTTRYVVLAVAILSSKRVARRLDLAGVRSD